MAVPMDVAIPVPVHFDGHNINIISDNLPQTAPVKSTGSPNKDRQSLYKTELCREWSTSGWCYYGKRCSFAHGLNELRPVFRSKKWRTKRCRNWQSTGYCPYEHRCQFLHDQSPPRRVMDEDGDDCKGQAGEATASPEETKGGLAGAAPVSSSSPPGDSDGDAGAAGGGGRLPSGSPTGSKELYFHFEVFPAADDEEESEAATDHSENGGGEKSPSKRRHKKEGEVLNEIGNSLSGEGARNEDAMNRPGKRKKRKKPPHPVVTQIDLNSLGQTESMRAKPRRGRSSSRSTSPVAATVQPIDVMQAHQILANQTTANQLAAQLATLQFQKSQLAAAAAAAAAAHQQQQNAMGATGSQQQMPYFDDHSQAMMLLQQQQNQLTTALQALNGVATDTIPVGGSPPPSIPMDMSGLAGATPSIPMSAIGGADTNALMAAMYAVGPSFSDVYYAAQLGQLPPAELEQLCGMGQYPSTAPVPFASAPMTPGGPLANAMGMTSQAGGPMMFAGTSAGVLPPTPSGSVEPPGFDTAFYPTPSPPPSSIGGLDSVQNFTGLRFVPQDSPAPPFGTQLPLFSQPQSVAGGPPQFLLPHCATPNPSGLRSSPPPMTPVFGTPQYPQYFPNTQPQQPGIVDGTVLAQTGVAGDPGNIVLFGGNGNGFTTGAIPIDAPPRRQ